MRISRELPVPPPEITMTFTGHEGWAIVMALNDAVARYKEAADRDVWKQWAKDLERELRR